jgi:PAS domain S-box-containing protein
LENAVISSDTALEVEELRQQVLELRKNEVRLNRQLKRLQNAMEQVETVAMVNSNVNDIRSAEQKKQEKYMQLLLGNSPDLIILFDRDQRFSYCTRAFLRRAGISSFDLINGRTVREVFSRLEESEGTKRIFVRIAYAAEEKKSINFEEEADIGGTGHPRRYEIHFTMMTNSAGDVEGSMMILHDITEMEQARRDAERAQRDAEDASRSKSEFLANMSHEIRTPMNAIIGMTHIAKSSEDVKKKDYCLDKIDEASVHLLGVINDILDMSKIEANKFDLSYTKFNFEKMLIKMVNVISFRLEEKHQALNVHLDGAIPYMIICDEQRLSQVITNLLSNAVKFTPERGEITIDARLIGEENDDCVLQISVRDTGIGVTEEQKSRLFHSFEQADSSTSRKFGGTGLGLAISRRIVEMMNGRIWVDSQVGEGSVFTFQIHALRVSEEGTPKFFAPSLDPGKIRVFAVDDSEAVRQCFAEIAGGFGLLYDTAEGGVQACEKIEKSGPWDICFVGWNLKDMETSELIRRLRDRGIPSVLVMASAVEWSAVEQEAKAAGSEGFVQKPLFPSLLAERINECFHAVQETQEKDGVKDISNCFLGYRILLAEDIEINREILIALLEPTAIEIVSARNGMEAFADFAAAPDRFDMIFMDVQMPEMDGYEATRRIRALNVERAVKIPIVAMTANVFREDIEKCMEAGMNDHLGKPLNFDDVMEKLSKYLPERGRTAARALT